MISLAKMLLGMSPFKIPTKAEPEPIESPRINASSSVSATMASYEKHRNETCTQCDKPRHISNSGKCHTTRCTEHYKADSEKYRKKSRSK
jgi:hypothetical protein